MSSSCSFRYSSWFTIHCLFRVITSVLIEAHLAGFMVCPTFAIEICSFCNITLLARCCRPDHRPIGMPPGLVDNGQKSDMRLLITRWKRRLLSGLTVIGLNSLGSAVPFTFGIKLTTPTLNSEDGKSVSNQRDMSKT